MAKEETKAIEAAPAEKMRSMTATPAMIEKLHHPELMHHPDIAGVKVISIEKVKGERRKCVTICGPAAALKALEAMAMQPTPKVGA